MSVREQLVALAKLGRIDASTHEFDQELKEIPKEVDQLRESVSLCCPNANAQPGCIQ